MKLPDEFVTRIEMGGSRKGPVIFGKGYADPTRKYRSIGPQKPMFG